MTKAIFWDKDGTLIPDIPYNVDPDRIRLYPDAGESLYRLRKAGFKLIVISNQAGVALGRFTEASLPPVWYRLGELLRPFDAEPDAYYYCPHHPEGAVQAYRKTCSCRKPAPGLLLQAAQDHQINLADSWVIGDILNDVEAGNRAGCRTVLVDRGNETEWLTQSNRVPTAHVRELQEATTYILSNLAR